MPQASKRAPRYSSLDGLRGWASLSVVVYHCVWQQFGTLFPAFCNFATAILGDGLTAVAVFFALSGYVLTRRRWNRTDNRSLPYAFVRRYVRFLLPVLFITIVAYALMSLQLAPTTAAYAVNPAPHWYDIFAHFQPDLGSALRFATWRTFGYSIGENYGPFLWTMAVELWGSLFIFALSQHPRYLREPYSPLLLGIVLALVLFPFAATFLAGAVIARAESDGWLFKTDPGVVESRVATVALVALLGLGALNQMFAGERSLYPSLLGVAIFVAVKRSRPVTRFLELPISQWLGRISFPLYLIQYAVIISIGAYLLIWLNAASLLNPLTAILHAGFSIALSLALAQLILPVELGTFALLRRMDQFQLYRPRQPVSGPAG